MISLFVICLFIVGSFAVQQHRPQPRAILSKHEMFSSIFPGNMSYTGGILDVRGSYKNGTHLFYMFFESQNNPDTAPTVLWLSGGPGCSSELAMLYENGPYKFDKNGKLVLNPYSWNTNANVLYIDSPVGTGYSYADYAVDYATNEDEVAQDLYTFLQEFFMVPKFTKYAKNQFSLWGESYAGHYVPYLANKIVKENKNHPSVHINLVSAAIGNGLVNLHEQVPGYYEFARINNYIGLVEEGLLEAASLACQGLISTVGGAAIVECNLYMAAVMEAISLNVGYQINPYNVKIPCAVEPLCYDFSNMTRFLDDPAVKKAIGAGSSPQTWAPCNFKVHGFLTADWVTDCSTQLPDVLEAGVRVVVYNGMLDYIVNWVTSRDWLRAFDWKGKTTYNNAPEKPWHVGGKVAGSSKTASVQGGLTFLKVEGAGHMVPADQPRAALQLLETVLQHKPF